MPNENCPIEELRLDGIGRIRCTRPPGHDPPCHFPLPIIPPEGLGGSFPRPPLADRIWDVVRGLYGIDLQYRADGWEPEGLGRQFRWRARLISAKHDALRMTVYGATLDEAVEVLAYRARIQREKWRRYPGYP